MFQEQPSFEVGETAEYVQLESRTLYSAAPIAIDVVDAADAGEDLAEQAVAVGLLEAEDNSAQESQPVDSATMEEQQERNELVLVDTATNDYQQLVDDILAQQSAGRHIEVQLLDSAQDGIEQISNLLKNYQDLDAIHLVSHGSDGAVKFGSTWLTSDSIAGYVGEIVGWQDAMAVDADLLIYGCDLASTAEGRTLIDMLAMICDCDVAASDDDTGHEDLGGDWILEYTVGQIETGVAFSYDVQASYEYVLAISDDATSTGVSTGGDFSINHTTSGTDRLMLVGVSMNLAGANQVNSITYNGDALSHVGTTVSGDARTEIWSLVAPDVGTYSVIIDINGTSDGNTAGVMTFTGVDQATPLGTYASGSGFGESSASVTVSSAADELVFGVVAVDDPNYRVLTEGGGQTENWELDGFEITGGGTTASGAASVNLTWTWPASDNWAASGVSIKAAAPTTTVTKTFQEGVGGYSGTVDTYVNEGNVSQNNSTNSNLELDLNDGGGGTTKQVLIRFEEIVGGGGSQIPADVYIASASLTVNVSNTSAPGANITMHEMLVGWSDTDNWSSMGTGISTDDIEAASTVSSTLANPSSLGSVSFTGLESDIQSWLSGGSTNNGWVIVSDSMNGWDINSSDSGNAPRLSVDYVVAGSQASTVNTLTVDTASDVLDGDATSIDTLLANRGADGMISLREAIWAANNTANIDGSTPDVINFAIGTGAQTIMVNAGGLPTITDALVLDATTQAGYSGTPLITLDGTNASGATAGINVRTNDSTIKGFIIHSFPDEGIEIDGTTGYGDNNIIENNWVGITSAGAAAGVGDDGILITEDADGNVIRNNVVGSGASDGILIRNGSDDNWVWGNLIGLADDGITDRGNTNYGVTIEGGAARNIIGTNADGTNDAAEGNTISGNSTGGVYVTGVGSDDNEIAGNLIGTDSSGSTLVSNTGNNVNINSGATGTIVGGAQAHAGNVIVGGTDGVTIWASGTTGTTVQGNYIGTDTSGTQDWGNSGSGIVVSGGATETLIGGSDPGEGNVIAFNDRGVATWDPTSDNNTILSNSIYLNDNLGIDHETTGVNANDTDDVDTGSNEGQNYPVITQAELDGTDLTVSGSLDTNGLTTQYRIEFFGAPSGEADTSNGEGRYYLGSILITTDGSGVGSFSGVVLSGVTLGAGDYVTATATRVDNAGQIGFNDLLAYGNTSEFAANTAIVNVNSAPTTSNQTVTTNEDSTYTFTAADFNYGDADGDPLNHIQITSLETVGSLELSGSAVTLHQIITKAQIDAGNLTFVPLADENGAAYDGFEFRVNDGSEYSASTSTISLSNHTFASDAEGYTYVDDAFGTSQPTLADGSYDATGGNGGGGGLSIQLGPNTSASAISGAFSNTFNLANDTLVQISIDHRMVLGEGYETNEYGELILEINGTRYGNDTNTSLIHLAGNNNGGGEDDTGWQTSTFEISLSAGTHTIEFGAFNNAGTAADEYVNAHFDNVLIEEAVFNSMSIDANSVNDAPVLDNAGDVTFTTITEDQAGNGGQTVASIIASAGGDRITDVDSGAVEGIAITANSQQFGNFQYSTNGGSTWNFVGVVSDTSALLLRSSDLIRFDPLGTNGGSSNVTFRAWDQTSGTAGTKVTTATNGGTSAFSSATEIAAITVTAVNDAPTITNGYTHTLTTTNEDTTSSGTLASAILTGASRADVDSGAVSGLAITATTGNGTWQYSTDGTTWNNFGAVSSTNALLITSSSQVRYIPDAANGETATFSYKAWDQTSGTASTNGTANYATTVSSGGTTAFSSNTSSAEIVVSSVNDAPVLDNSGNITFTSITEDQTANSGQTVASIISSAGGDRITDVDSGAIEGIAITATTNGNGSWEYSTSGGSTWNSVGTVSSSSSLLLRSIDLVRFVPDAQNATTGDMTFRAWDQTGATAGQHGTKVDSTTNGGTTSFSSSTEVASISVTAVNDAPINAVPGTQAVSEDTTTSIAGISISDVDAAGSNLTSRLQVSNGVLNVTLSGSATISTGTNGTADLTIQGTVTDINATLASLTYTGNTNVVGTAADTLTITTNDGGNTGTGGALQDVDNIQIDITPVNDAPVVNAPVSALAATEQVGLAIHGTGFNVSDVDEAGSGATATLSVGEGALIIAAGDSGITIDSGNGSGIVTISGSIAQINNLLTAAGTGTITYLNGSDTPSVSTTITVTVNDQGNTGADPGLTGDGTSEEGTNSQTINITATNDDPTNAGSLPSDISVTEDVASNVDLSAINLSDVDHGGGNLTVTLSTSTGGNLSASSGGGVTVGGSGTGTLTLTGTLASLNSFLDTASNVQYLHGTANTFGNDADTINVVVNDLGNTGTGGGTNQNLGTVNVDINAVNDAPINVLPGSRTVYQNGSITFSTANGSDIVVTDVDAGGSTIEVSLVSTNGLMTLNGTAGLSFSLGDGTADGSITFTGTATAINNALDGMVYTPTTNFTGIASIQVTTNDQGNIGSGGALNDVDVITINVIPANSVSLWLDTDKVATVNGGSSWTDGEVINFAAPGLALEPGTTSGTFSSVLDLDAFALDGDADISGLHRVLRTVVVGTGGGSMTLQKGDVLFSIQGTETLGGVAVTEQDLVLFRPTVLNDYSSGTFSIVINSPTGDKIREVALVEHNLSVGGVALNAGDLLLVQGSGAYDKDVWRFQATSVGDGTTAGTFTELINGADIGLTEQLGGLALVETTTTIGNVTLASGELLLNLRNAAMVGTNSLSVTKFDIFRLDVTQAGATTVATASMFFQGADVGLSTGGEEFHGLALVATNYAPTLSGANNFTSIAEDAFTNSGTLVSSLISGHVSDVDESALSGIAVTAVDNTNGSWQYSINSGAGWNNFGSPTGSSARLLAIDASTLIRFVPNANYNGNASITFRAWDQTTGSIGSTADTTNNGGATAFSTAVATANINVTSVNDATILSTMEGTSLAYTENDGAVAITSSLAISDVDDTNIESAVGADHR